MFALEHSGNEKISKDEWQSLSMRETTLTKVLRKYFSHLFKVSIFQTESYNLLVDYKTKLLFILFCIFKDFVNLY